MQRERLPRFVEIGSILVQPAQAAGGIERDGGKRLVDLMRQRCGKFAERRQPRHAGEVRLGISQRLFGVPALGDVHHRADEFETHRTQCCRAGQHFAGA